MSDWEAREIVTYTSVESRLIQEYDDCDVELHAQTVTYNSFAELIKDENFQKALKSAGWVDTSNYKVSLDDLVDNSVAPVLVAMQHRPRYYYADQLANVYDGQLLDLNKLPTDIANYQKIAMILPDAVLEKLHPELFDKIKTAREKFEKAEQKRKLAERQREEERRKKDALKQQKQKEKLEAKVLAKQLADAKKLLEKHGIPSDL